MPDVKTLLTVDPLDAPDGWIYIWLIGTGGAPDTQWKVAAADLIGGSTPEASAAEIWTGTEVGKYVSPAKVFASAAFQPLTDDVTITPDFGAGFNFKVTLAGNRTLANPTNAKQGQSGVIKITQDGTGTRTLAYGANWRFPGGAAAGGVLSTAPGAVDHIAYVVDDAGLIIATLSKAFAA